MSRPERRVAITGIGLLTPLGNDLATNWQNLIAARSGIAAIRRFDATTLPVRIAGEIRDFDPAVFIEKKDIRKTDAFTQYALAAAQMAVDDARLQIAKLAAERIGVVIGVGMGGINTVEGVARTFHKTGSDKVGPFFIPRLIANMAPAQVAIRFGAKGTNRVVTSACASGGDAIGDAARLIRFGYQDVMLAGGSEAGITYMCIGGFAAMRALSTRNDEPQRACRPFDRDRDGFVISEGAAILVLESLDAAVERGARIYAEVAGFGANADAYHITIPSPAGEGAARCMQLALEDGGIEPWQVDYINAHGTSTPYNDANETSAIKLVFGEHAARVAVSSTKSMTGHALGAAGAIEAAYTALTLHHQVIPPTINYENRDPQCDLDYVPNVARAAPVRVALSNAFGFGGSNCCLAMRRYPEP
ncbi:MAG TPA: beta-ketoacyl-ACP synthase II [Candidatus Acidoferrales bacterium]|nr:beta-ketoacyl-ACP synthase II [Candidatus Acidoferrales bacterium]